MTYVDLPGGWTQDKGYGPAVSPVQPTDQSSLPPALVEKVLSEHSLFICSELSRFALMP